MYICHRKWDCGVRTVMGNAMRNEGKTEGPSLRGRLFRVLV